MRNQFFLIIAMLLCITVKGQYDTWSIEPHVGVTKVRDVTPVRPFNTGLAVRKMLNTKFGVRLSGNYTRLYENYEFNNFEEEYPLSYTSGTLEGVMNVGRILQFESFAPWYTILVGVGGTYTYSNQQTNKEILHRYSNFHLSGVIDNEFHLNGTLSLKASLGIITGVNNRPFIDDTQTTSIINFNLGIVINLGKNKKHADWHWDDSKYVTQQDFTRFTLLQNQFNEVVNDNINDLLQLVKTSNDSLQKQLNNQCDCSVTEFIAFENDSDNLGINAINSILKIKNYLADHDDKKLLIIGHSSNTTTTSEQYDLALSQSRADKVKNKLISLGIDQDRIIARGHGKDYSMNNDHDTARKTTLLIY